MKRIWWLASYPKSGNTWFRAFLTSLIGRDLEGSLLDNLEGGPIGSSREVFDLEAGVDSEDLTFEETQRLRPDVFRSYARRSAEPLYLKIHDARVDPETGVDLAPPDATLGAIYLIRNPLDVAVSWAHHCGSTVEKGAGCLLRPKFSLLGNEKRGFESQVKQVLGCWSAHVKSWIDHDEFPTLALRFEDTLADSVHQFSAAEAFLGLGKSPEEIGKAIEASTFEKLQRLEQDGGFGERPCRSQQFFRRGKSGAWRDELPEEWVHRIVDTHGEMMRRFGYLNERGEPVF